MAKQDSGAPITFWARGARLLKQLVGLFVVLVAIGAIADVVKEQQGQRNGAPPVALDNQAQAAPARQGGIVKVICIMGTGQHPTLITFDLGHMTVVAWDGQTRHLGEDAVNLYWRDDYNEGFWLDRTTLQLKGPDAIAPCHIVNPQIGN